MGALLCCCRKNQHERLPNDETTLVRFTNFRGPAVRASNWSVSGSGTALANACLIQTRAYWEVTIVEPGAFWVGVARKSNEDLEKQLGERPFSWALYSGAVGNNYKAGDTIGISFDLSGIRAVLSFQHNGRPISSPITDVKGDVYPAVSVSDGAVLQANFGATPYKYPIPDGFEPIILSQDLI